MDVILCETFYLNEASQYLNNRNAKVGKFPNKAKEKLLKVRHFARKCSDMHGYARECS